MVIALMQMMQVSWGWNWGVQEMLEVNKKEGGTVDGWNPAPVEVGSLSHYLQGFIHPRWCKISAINNITKDIYLFFFK